MKIVRNEKGVVTKECLCEIHRSLPIAVWEEGKENIMYIDEYSWDFFVRELVVYMSFTDWVMFRMANISNVESAILKELNKIENVHNIRIPLVSKGSILSRVKNALVFNNKSKTTIMKQDLEYKKELGDRILGRLLINNATANKAELLDRDDFESEDQAIVFDAIRKVLADGTQVDALTVLFAMCEDDKERLKTYVLRLTTLVVSTSALDKEIEELKQLNNKDNESEI